MVSQARSVGALFIFRGVVTFVRIHKAYNV